MNSKYRLVILATALLVLAGEVGVDAANRYWSNTGGGDFTNGANWVGGTVPGTNDIVYFTNSATYQVDFTSSPTNYQAFFTQNGGTLTLNIGAGNTWVNNLQGQFTGWQFDGTNANFDISSGALSAINFGSSYIGFSGYGNTIMVDPGATLASASSISIGATASGSSNTLLVNGATATLNTYQLAVGGAGSYNSLILSNGTVAQPTILYIGASTGGNSNLVDVTGSTLGLNNGNLFLGYKGDYNTLRISNGGLVSNVAAYVGGWFDGVNPSTFVTGNYNRVIVDNGTWSNTYSFVYIGESGTGNSVLVTNNGKMYANSANLLVGGDRGYGSSLTVADGGQVFDSALRVGYGSGSSNNTLTVTGTNAYINPFSLFFGNVGNNNSLIVSNTGFLLVRGNFNNGGLASASDNTAVVSGTGSVIGVVGELQWGYRSDNNTLRIENGGLVTNSTPSVGGHWNGVTTDGTGSFNRVTVDNAVWSNTVASSGIIYLGESGTGNSVLVTNNGRWYAGEANSMFLGGHNGPNTALTVADGGQMFVGTTYIGVSGPSSNNIATVTGSNAFVKSFTVVVGNGGQNNSLVVSNNAFWLDRGNLVLGAATSASNNTTIVNGGGSILAINGDARVGYNSDYNTLRVENGGVVTNTSHTYIGGWFDGANASTFVTGNYNRVIVDGGTYSNLSGYTYIGMSGTGNSLLVTNGGKYYGGSTTFELGGNQGFGNSLTVADGGQVVMGNTYIGYLGGSSNNVATVTGSNAYVNSYFVALGNNGYNNSLIVSNGGFWLGRNNFLMGNAASASNNTATVSGTNSTLGILSELRVGYKSGNNTLRIENGGLVSNLVSYIGGYTDGSIGNGNRVVVDNGTWIAAGAGFWTTIGQHGTGNSVLITNGGYMLAPYYMMVGNGTGATNSTVTVADRGQLIAGIIWAGFSGAVSNRVLVVKDGLLECNDLRTSVGGNTISNVGGIYQFTTAGSPNIAPSSFGTIAISNGTISYRGVNNADVKGNWTANQLTNMSFSGSNTFRLNSASNSSTIAQTYLFDTGRGATNYNALEMVNGVTRWQNGSLTIGGGGHMLVSNTVATIAGAFASTGDVTVVNSKLTFNNAALIAGKFVSDPSTNTFAADVTIAPGGSLAGGTGDRFEFSKSLFIQATNNQDFKLQASSVAFIGGGMHTNQITGLDLGAGPFAHDSAFALGTNFAYGELHLGSAADQICFSCDNTQPSNALYIGWLDLLSDTFYTNLVANLHASNNITLYYAGDDVRNAYLNSRIFQLTQCDGVTLGGFLMPVIPEPSALMLFGLGTLVLIRRRR